MSDVAPAPSLPSYPDVLGHPRPLWMLFMTEFWERFCYYGMRWALTLYIVAGFYGGDPTGEAPANATYGAYTALVYAFGVLGGYVADRLLGFQRTVMLGGAFIALGLFTMLVKNHDVFLIGLSLIIVGNGLFKPNISTMVGGLYGATDARRDRGFTIFYMGINAGAFFAPLLTGWLANNLLGGTPESPNYSVVFATAGIGMVLGLIWFGLGRGMLLGNGAPPKGKEGLAPIGMVTVGGLVMVPVMFLLLSQTAILTYLLIALFGACLAMLVAAGRKSDKVQMDRIWALLILFVANILFWMFFEQAGTSFNFLAENVVDRRMSFAPDGVFPTGWFQSVNPLAIVLLAPLVTIVWRWTDKRGIEPSIPRKFGLGLIGNALGFAVLMWGLSSMVFESEGKSMIPLWPLAFCYLLQTLGELCLSPIGLSMVTKLAPPKMVGATMGAWFMSVALGNKLAGVLAEQISGEKGLSIESAQTGFQFSFWLLVAAGLVVLLVSPKINRLMHGIK